MPVISVGEIAFVLVGEARPVDVLTINGDPTHVEAATEAECRINRTAALNIDTSEPLVGVADIQPVRIRGEAVGIVCRPPRKVRVVVAPVEISPADPLAVYARVEDGRRVRGETSNRVALRIRNRRVDVATCEVLGADVVTTRAVKRRRAREERVLGQAAGADRESDVRAVGRSRADIAVGAPVQRGCRSLRGRSACADQRSEDGKCGDDGRRQWFLHTCHGMPASRACRRRVRFPEDGFVRLSCFP